MKKQILFLFCSLFLISNIFGLTYIQYSANEYYFNELEWMGWPPTNWTNQGNLIDNDYSTWARPDTIDYPSNLIAKYYIPATANLSETQIHIWLYNQDTLNVEQNWVSGNHTLNSTLTTSYWTYGDLTDCDIHNDIGGDYINIIYDDYTETAGGSNYVVIGCQAQDYTGGAYNYYEDEFLLFGEPANILYIAQGPDTDNPVGDIEGSRIYEEEIHWSVSTLPYVCTPQCTNKECGDDGCGGSCGTCLDGFTCNSEQKCISSGLFIYNGDVTKETSETSNPISNFFDGIINWFKNLF